MKSLTKNNKSTIELSIIVPIYNEEQVIPELYERLTNTVADITPNYELIFVNDGSKDRSFIQLKNLAKKDKQVFYINFSRNFGHQIAVSAGLDACRGNAVVIIDADLQDPPELIADLYARYNEGFEVVYAKRATREGDTLFKKMTAKLFYRLLSYLTRINIPLDTGDFRLIDRKVVDCLNQMPEQNKFLRGQIAWLGFRQSEVLFDRKERKYGTTGYSLQKMIRLALDGITGFSDKPLQLVTLLGFLISAVSFGIILYAACSHFVLARTVTGWTSLIASVALFGGIQLLAIGIIGEYINRMNKNVNNRPLYVLDQTNLVEDKMTIVPTDLNDKTFI